MIPTDLAPVANHLWQSTLCAAAAWLLTLALRRNRAAVRYSIWLAASVKFLIPFSLLTGIGSQLGRQTVAAIAQPQFSLMMNEISRPFALPAEFSPLTAAPRTLSSLSSILFGVWFSGFILGLLFWAWSLLQIHAIKSKATALHLKFPLPVMSSSARLEPGVFGIRRPILILPAGITERLTPAQLEAVLAHELCHVRRRDNLTAAIHMAVEAIFRLHPQLWWVRTQLVAERERACDEEVLAARHEAPVYAEAILNVCRFCIQLPSVGAAGVMGSNLKNRIEAIVENRRARDLTRLQQGLIAFAALGITLAPIAVGLAGAPGARAQQRDAPTGVTFEVASVKVNKSGERAGSFEFTPDRLTVRNMAIPGLIMRAYNLSEQQLSSSVPLSVATVAGSTRYDIDAKAAHAASRAEILLMLRSLLANRFHLSMHSERKEVSGYALAIDKDVPKMHEHAGGGGDCIAQRGKNGEFRFQNCTTEYFVASILSGIVRLAGDRPVEDQTGLKGSYDFELLASWEVPANPSEDRQEPTVVNSGAPSIFDAVRQQLGLRLRPQKITLEFYNVDHVEKPSEN